MIEAIMPTKAIAIGNISREMFSSSPASAAARPPATEKAVSATGAMIEPT